MGLFFVLYDKQLGFVAKNSNEIPEWTSRLKHALQFPSAKMAQRYIYEQGYTGYILSYGSTKNPEVIEIALRDKRNNKYIKEDI